MNGNFVEKGRVLELFISSAEHSERLSPDELIADESGIEGDKFRHKDENRSILITSIESYEMAREQGIEVAHGSLGENILIDFNPYHLLPGDKLIIGGVLLEITQNCTLCKSLTKVDKRLPKLLRNDRGIFAKALNTGSIRIGDSVSVPA